MAESEELQQLQHQLMVMAQCEEDYLAEIATHQKAAEDMAARNAMLETLLHEEREELTKIRAELLDKARADEDGGSASDSSLKLKVSELQEKCARHAQVSRVPGRCG